MPAEKIPSWIERILLPSLNEIKGEFKAVNARIDSTNEKIDSLRNETKTEIEGLRKEMLSKFETTDNKITSLDERIVSLRNETKTEIASVRTEIISLRTEMTIKFDSLEKRIPVIEKIAVLELRIAEIEKRLAAA